MSNIWKTLPQHFVGLSPMDGVTDHPFRHLQKKYGNPDLIYTEFTSVEGIAHGATRLLKDFLYDDSQRPILAQIFGHTPKDFRTAATLVCLLGFDGVDINMGCPAKNIASQGSGAALILTPKLAQEIVKQTKHGVQDWVNGANLNDLPLTSEMRQVIQPRIVENTNRITKPVSVKTRVGYDQPVVGDWMKNLLEMEPVAIAIHGRTLKQGYSGKAAWEQIGKAVQVAQDSETLIVGNGDVKSKSDAREKMKTYGVDGVLIGRAAMGNPWVFMERKPTTAERFQIAKEHIQLYQQAYGNDEHYHFLPMRKHLGWYIKDFPNASEVRTELFKCQTAEEAMGVLNNFKAE